MLIRPLREEEHDLYNSVVDHPLQTWEWGTFRRRTGLDIDRVGFFENGKIKRAYQVTFHPIPILGKTAGYLPKGFMPDDEQLASLRQLGEQHNALFIKLEPNVMEKVGVHSGHPQIAKYLTDHGCQAGRPLFTKYTFVIDLTQDEDKLFAGLSSKTRYNVNVAQKNGVQIFENSTKEGMEEYITILKETTERQGFYAHGPEYFRTMWEVLGASGMLKIFHAVYDNTILTTWIVFIHKQTLYYPYGASLRIHKDVMANNLMMWEMIRYGKAQGCTAFDLWGSLGPEPDPKHPWFGFHRFKKGYGGDLYQTIGTYDLVLGQTQYPLFKVAEDVRWKLLRFKAKLGF